MPDNAKDRAATQLAKLQKAEEGKKNLSAYEAEAAAVRAKTERLKALRLARDAAQPPEPAPAKPRAAKGKGKKQPSGTLSDWIKAQKDGGHNN